MDLYGALADPTRRRILEVLSAGPRTVNDIVEAVGYHQPGVSRHLRVLHDAGLVQAQPDGQRRVYSLCLEPFLEVQAWVHHQIASFADRLGRLGAVIDENATS